MTASPTFHASDWATIKLVVFDVDGTLYNQRLLRMRMALDLSFHIAKTRDVRLISVLRTYRRIRERLADQGVGNFELQLIAETSMIEGCSENTVRAIVAEWIEQRPLAYLEQFRYAGLVELFSALRRKNKVIGILSDYPARAKLAALGLSAEYVVSASDDGIGYLKPHPRGLQSMLAAAGVESDATVLIGDRAARDGVVAERVGVQALIRSSRSIQGYHTFSGYDAPLFMPLLSA